MMGTKMRKIIKWGPSEYLEREADIAACHNAPLEDRDTSVIATALGDCALKETDAVRKGGRHYS